MRSFQQNSRHQNTVRRDPKTLTNVYDIGELKQRRFSATRVNRKWCLLPFNMPRRYQNWAAKCPFSYKEDLQNIWVKPLPNDAKPPLPVAKNTSGCKNPTSGWRAPCLSSLLPATSATSQRTFSGLWRLIFVVKRTQKRHCAKADTSITDEVSFDYVWYVISYMTAVLFFFSSVQVSYIDLAKNSGYGEFAKLVEASDTTSSHLILNWRGI